MVWLAAPNEAQRTSIVLSPCASVLPVCASDGGVAYDLVVDDTGAQPRWMTIFELVIGTLVALLVLAVLGIIAMHLGVLPGCKATGICK